VLISVEDQNGSSFGCSTQGGIGGAIERCKEYARPGDIFRVYVQDEENPYPGYIAAWVDMDREGTLTVRTDEVTIVEKNS
jgi:hypothetical protein